MSNIALRQQRCNRAVFAAWEFSYLRPVETRLGLCRWHVFREVVDRWLKRGGEAPERSSSQSGTFVDPDQSGLGIGRRVSGAGAPDPIGTWALFTFPLTPLFV